MPNIKLTLQYDGTDFSGYELQTRKRTIRGEIEKSIAKIFKHKIKINGVSRTDSGVHALYQVVNFKTKTSIPLNNIVKALNSILPEDIRILDAQKVKPSFNARYAAKSKEYEYLIYNGDILPPHLRRFVWQVKPKLNLQAMRKEAKKLVGKHDFSAFCAAGGDDTDFVRIIHKLVIRRLSFVIWHGAKFKMISIRVEGNGFLYKMVRNMVGKLVEVGLGKTSKRCAPPQGLCLVKVNF